MKEKTFYMSPVYFDLINLVFINLVFFAFYREAVSGPLLLRAAIGTPIALLSFYFESKACRVLEECRSHPERVKKLITHGVYSNIRHPIYLGRILLNLGFLIILPIIPMLVVAVVFIMLWYIVALYEEKLLVKRFGKRYHKYKEKVPMFIPKKSTS